MGHGLREMDPTGISYPYHCESKAEITLETDGQVIKLKDNCQLNMKPGPKPHDGRHKGKYSTWVDKGSSDLAVEPEIDAL